MKYEDYFKKYLDAVEAKLKTVMPAEEKHPPVIHDAMAYAVFTGGKRFRPVLTLTACEAVGGSIEKALLPACAVELIHSYSLVHDDLPALDNDDVRRGKPTCHKRYGEAMAILAGDGLLTYAFQLLAQVKPAARALSMIEELSTAAGTYGMIGGQVADLAIPPEDRDLPALDYISVHKTGKLIKASAVLGALAGDAQTENLERLRRFGEWIGLAFQAIDDMLDQDGYVQVLKAKDLRLKSRDLIAQSKREVKPLGKRGEKLIYLADFLLERIPRRTHVAVDR